jgi:hypothetical protein
MPGKEPWLFRIEVDRGPHSGRLVARALKCLLRSFGLKCSAILDPSAKSVNPPTDTPGADSKPKVQP